MSYDYYNYLLGQDFSQQYILTTIQYITIQIQNSTLIQKFVQNTGHNVKKNFNC
jgi:hypothetical protein